MEQLVQQILDALVEAGNNWLSFRQLAVRIRGDAQDADLIGAFVESRLDLFCIHADRRCKIRAETIEAASRIEIPENVERPPVHVQAAQAVREYARQLSPLRVRVIGTDKGKLVLDRFLHALQMEVSDDFRFSDDTPVELLSADGRRNSGHIAGASRDEATLFVAFQSEVFPVDLPAWLEVSRAKPLFNLAEYLSSLVSVPKLSQLLSESVAPIECISDRESGEVAMKLVALKTPWTRLLWGPPGAGKTYCSARMAANIVLSSPSERVLIVAPSNVAVDAALAEVLAALEGSEGGRRLLTDRLVVRYGYPRDERITSRPELFGPADLEPISLEIHGLQLEIRRLRQMRVSEQEVAEAKARLQQLQSQRKARISDHLSRARILATTVASAFTGTNSIVASNTWPTVIADEASMLAGATVLALSGLATSRYLLVGDPRQLAPIFEWNQEREPPKEVRRWLAQDPYEFAGLSSGSGWLKQIRTADGRMARILAQRRCHPRIWALVKQLYPQVETLIDHSRVSAIASVPPLAGEPAVVLDLSQGRTPKNELKDSELAEDLKLQWESACRRVSRTWENPPTAMLSIDVARDIHARIPDATIAIITPYRGQTNLIRRWLYAERQADPKLDRIEVGTVHSFQGGEADVVIFDMVDGPPRQRPGILFRDDVGMRLVNVAVTRARGKLVLIAHKDWVHENDPGKMGILWNILFGAASRPQNCPVLPPQFDVSQEQLEVPGIESPIEGMLFGELTKIMNQIPSFTLQHRILNEQGKIVSRADIAFVSEQIAIFCDGAEFHLRQPQWQRDLRQRRELSRLGWTILAFTGREIRSNPGGCADDIVRVIRARRSKD